MRHNGAVQKPPIFAPAALLAAAVAWAITLAFGEPTIGTAAAAVAAVDLLIVTLVAIVGLVVVRARWARRFSMVVIGLMAGMALTMPISNNWMVALLLSGLAVSALVGPSLEDYLRPPTPGGPPPKSVALLLILLVLPGVTAFLTGSPVPIAAWFVIVGAPGVAWAYGKTRTEGLWAARIGIPVAGLVTLWGLDWWAVVLLAASVAGEAWLAWSGEAARPLDRQSTAPATRSMAIPPELAPPEILAAAGLDDRGRRLPRSSTHETPQERGQ